MQKTHLVCFLIFLHLHLYVCAQPSTSSKKVNVVFILADDLGFGETGCYGQAKIQTNDLVQQYPEKVKALAALMKEIEEKGGVGIRGKSNND